MVLFDVGLSGHLWYLFTLARILTSVVAPTTADLDADDFAALRDIMSRFDPPEPGRN